MYLNIVLFFLANLLTRLFGC